MSETAGTLAHALLIGDRNIVDAGCSDILNDSPILAALQTTLASHGTKHTYLKEDGSPVVGFRPVNTGRVNTHSTDIEVSQDLKYLDPSWDKDVAIVDAYPALKGGPLGFIDRESKRFLRASFFGAEKQIIYGTDVEGFTGLKDAATVQYADSLMTVNAGGTAVDNASSVWFIRTDATEREAMFVLGEQGQITVPSQALTIQKLDGDGNPYYAYAVVMGGWFGMQVGSKYSIGRIVNLTAEAGKGLTDDLIYSMLEKFPASRGPTFMAMNKRSLEQLRKSRTATNATGAPAPMPTEVASVPIITSDSLISTEPFVGATP